jgi:hypothetical protein
LAPELKFGSTQWVAGPTNGCKVVLVDAAGRAAISPARDFSTIDIGTSVIIFIGIGNA